MAIMAELYGFPIIGQIAETGHDQPVSAEGFMYVMFRDNAGPGFLQDIDAFLVRQGVTADLMGMSGNTDPSDFTLRKQQLAAFQNGNLMALNVAMQEIEIVPFFCGHQMGNRIAGAAHLTARLTEKGHVFGELRPCKAGKEFGCQPIESGIGLTNGQMCRFRLKNHRFAIGALVEEPQAVIGPKSAQLYHSSRGGQSFDNLVEDSFFLRFVVSFRRADEIAHPRSVIATA
ncbi:hypothetical protein [Ruegeria atlantica]|uniref:Uncharacterized protein n=1 Tax=Ruegeria atlantica TaxID=81569 RepID=A0ABX1WH03_9RHOB|nr:hypothetical protein [Ruegeria atlantica]NOD32617.1 hypothetical protein [Ruegeria atlantica]